jgi:hypothetical protein
MISLLLIPTMLELLMAMEPATGSMASSSYLGLRTLTNLLATIWGGLADRSTVNVRLSI